MKNDDDNLVDKEIQMLARLWQRKRSDEGRYSSIMGSAIFTKNFKLIFCVFPPSLCLIVPRALV